MPLDPAGLAAQAPYGRRPLDPVDLAAQGFPDRGVDAADLAARAPAYAPPEPAPIHSVPAHELTAIYGNEFSKGLRRGTLGIIGTTEGYAAQVAEPFSTKLSNQLFEEANRTLDFEEGLRPKVPTWEDVHGIGSFFDYGLGKAGEALPSTAASLAAAGVGGAAGLGLRAAGLQAAGRLPLSFAAGSLSMLPQEGGESAISLHNDPRAMARTTPWQRLGVSSLKGGVNAALEFTPEALALNRAFKAPLIRRGLGRALAETGLGGAEAITGEAITEGLQEKTGQIAQSYANPQRDTSQDTANIREAMLGGAFGGFGMGAAGGGIHALRSNVLPQPGEEAPPAAPAPPSGGAGLFNFVSNLGHSVNQKLRQSDEWSEAKGKDLKLLRSNPEFADALNKLPEGEQRAVIGTLHAIRAAPNLLDSEGGQTANDLLNSYFGDNSLNRLSAALQQPGNEKVSHLGPSAIDQPRDANAFRSDYDQFGELKEEDRTEQEGQQEGFLNDVLPADKLGINRDILSAALQNRAHFRYGEATPSDKAMTDIPLRFTSSDGTMSAQDFIRSLTTQDFKPGERPRTREHTEQEIAYHSQDGSAELPVSPMSLVSALSTAYKDQLGDLREGQTGHSGQRKGDLFMSALTTLLNDGISITDAEGKAHHFNVEIGAKAKTGKNGDLPDNLLIHHDSQTGGYTIGDYKREGGKLYGAADAEALTLERGLIEQFAPLADDQKAWDNLYFKIKKEAPFGSPLNKALWKVGQNKDKLDVLLGKNIRNTVSNGLRTIKEDLDDIVNDSAEQTDGNSSQLLNELQDYLGSDGANEPSSAVKKLFSDNNVPLFSHDTLSSEALKNDKGLRPQDSFLGNIEYLHNRATENYNFGLLSETESNEGKNAEVSDVPGINNAVWGTAGKPKIINQWTGELGKRITEQTKASFIQGHRNYQNIISNLGAWRIEAEGGQRAGYFKTQKEAEQFINDIPKGGFQILYKKYPYSIEKAKKKWPGWKEEFGKAKKDYSTDQVSIFNPETGEILSLAGQDFKNLPPEAAIQYLHGINKTLAQGTKLSAVDTTPMHTTAEAMPTDVAQLVHDRELRGESVAKLREAYAGTSRPLTAADLEKGIQTVPEEVQTKPAPSERTARGAIVRQDKNVQAKLDLQSEQDLEDVRTQLSIERERKVDKNPALIKELEAEEARLIQYTPEGTAPARIRKEFAEHGITDDFGNRVLPPKIEEKVEVTPREKRLQELAVDKGKRLRREEHYTRSHKEEEAAIEKVRKEKGEEAAQKERARIETLRTNKRDKNLVTGRKSAEELEAAGELDKPDTMAPHAKRHKELSEKAKVKAEAEATAKARREGVEPGNILFTTSTAADYITRTGANANADATIALAVDFDSPGEKATKRLVKQKSKAYIPINYNGEEKATDEQVKAAVNALNEIPKQEISLNIAGNGIVTLNEQGHGDQAKIDAYTQDFLERVLDHPDLKKKVTSVRTGGQTGFDEAGAKAAQYLGIPVEVHAPRNWMFRVVDKTESSGYRDIKNEIKFKARFTQPEKSGVAHEVSQPEKAAATYEAEQKQREAEVATDVADRDKPPSVRAFDNYVKSGRYSQWHRDSVERVGKEKTDEMSREIREYRLSQIPELKDANIGVDGSTIVNIPENVKAQLRSGVDGRISRLMVGNHGVYVEFVPTKEMTGGKVHLQYVEHKDAAGNKLYEQTRKVNYADYKVGRWYVAATDILGKTAPVAPTTTQAPTSTAVHEEPMTFPMPANTNVTGKATTTFQLVKDGLRTATTRHWGRLPKVGDIISFYNRGKTDTVKVRVTNVGPRLGKVFEEGAAQGKSKNDVLTDLSKAEGWTPEAFIDHYDNGNGATVNDDSRQVTYELVDKPAAPAAPLPPLSSMVKRGRTHPSQMPPRSIKQRAEAKRALAAAQLEGRRARASFISMLRKMGGISTREAPDITGEKEFRANQMGGGIFRSDGHAMDLVADKLYEQGYISEEEHEDVDGGVQRARDLIKEALEGGIVAPIGRLEEILGNIRAAEEQVAGEDKPTTTGMLGKTTIQSDLERHLGPASEQRMQEAKQALQKLVDSVQNKKIGNIYAGNKLKGFVDYIRTQLNDPNVSYTDVLKQVFEFGGRLEDFIHNELTGSKTFKVDEEQLKALMDQAGDALNTLLRALTPITDADETRATKIIRDALGEHIQAFIAPFVHGLTLEGTHGVGVGKDTTRETIGLSTILLGLHDKPQEAILETANHEVLHAALTRIEREYGIEAVKKIVDAAQAPHIVKQVLDQTKDETAQAYFKANPEEMLAQAYGLWATGKLKLEADSKLAQFFKQLRDAVLEIIGKLKGDPLLAETFGAIQRGELSNRGRLSKEDITQSIGKRKEAGLLTYDTSVSVTGSKAGTKESTQSTPTPGVAQPSATQTATNQLIQTLVEKMFGKKVNVVFGIPNMTKNRKARGWYEGRSKLNELKANEAKLEQVRNKRREALAAGDQQEVAAMDAREQRLLRQEEVLGTIYLNPNNSIREMLPTFYHEAVHAAFDILLSPAERAILGTAFSHGTVRRQLEKIFANDAGVLAQMKDAEEAAAYGFQIHAVAPHMLQISDKLAAIFAKVAKWFREMTGALSAEDKAEIIMNDMLAGRLAGNGMSAVQTVLAADQTTQQKIAKHFTVVREMLQKMWDVIASPSYKRLIDTGNPALIAFAKAGHTKTGEHGDLGMIQRMQTEISARFNWVDKIQSKYTHDQLQAVAEHRMKNTYPTDPTLQRAYKDVDTFFNEFKKYADDAKMNIGFIKNYWPMMWDAAKVIANKAAFLAMVSHPKYAAEMAALKATPEELYENISSYVTRGDSFQNIMSPTGEPANAYSKERSLSFLEYDDRKQFMHDDPVQTMVNYTSNMIRQAEYVRKYGQGGALRDAMLKEAKEKYGATDTQISLAKDYLDGLLGNKEVGMSRELKDIYGAIAVYQNYRLLSFNLFSSLMDPWGIAIRSGRLADGLETFIYSLKNIFRDLKKNRPDADKDMWEKLALDWGYIEDAGTMSSLRHMMETTELRGFSKKMNDALFKWNLLNGWTRSTKIMAVKAGQRFMARIAQGNSSHDARHLKELGLTAADIMPTTEGNIALRKDEFVAQGMSEANAIKQEAKMREAMTKFVNQAILNPTAADLPNWGSNPYWAPIFHLKQFMFTFQTTILDRIWHEAKEGNLKPLWIATIYIPGTIAAEALRGFVSNFGSQPPWQKDWGPVDYVKNGYARSGLMGTGQLFASIQDDIMHGGAGYESAVGPMVEQFYKGLRAVAKGDTSFFNFVVKSMPLNQIYDQWLLTHHTGPMGKHYGPNAVPATSK